MNASRQIPPGIQYGTVSPEGVDCDIRLIKFTPVSTITAGRPGDIVKFLI
jgi:hypothetical protein